MAANAYQSSIGNVIYKFVRVCYILCFKPGMLWDLSIKPTWQDVVTWFQYNPESKLCKYSLLWLAWHIRAGDQYLPSIHSWDSGPWKMLYVPLFLKFLTFPFSVCDINNKIISFRVYLTNFLIIKFVCLFHFFFYDAIPSINQLYYYYC